MRNKILELGGVAASVVLIARTGQADQRRDLAERHREIRSLEDVNESMADVEAGRVSGRVVFRP